MAFDHRFPMLHRISDATTSLPGVDATDVARIRRTCMEIARRSGTNAIYNHLDGKATFVYGDQVTGGPISIQVKRRRHEGHEIDLAVEAIGFARIGRREKDRIAAANAAHERHEKEQFDGEFLDGVRPDALDRAGFIDRRRRGTQTTVLTV